ncbi:hypothetical protein GCM10022276_11210 [Sphingomonas limnosediminicola]|uniref:Uncharacterized protein n=2 Tax=Sphingomonas limnosediminicola TaxID=940133 RepID=A0ABP7L3S6_9SPHN
MHEIEFDHFAGMTRNEMETDPPWQLTYRSYYDGWSRGNLIGVDRLLPKLGLRRIGSIVDWVNP